MVQAPPTGSTDAAAPCGYRDVKLNVSFPCGELGSVITEVQLILKFNADLKLKVGDGRNLYVKLKSMLESVDRVERLPQF